MTQRSFAANLSFSENRIAMIVGPRLSFCATEDHVLCDKFANYLSISISCFRQWEFRRIERVVVGQIQYHKNISCSRYGYHLWNMSIGQTRFLMIQQQLYELFRLSVLWRSKSCYIRQRLQFNDRNKSVLVDHSC